MLTSNAPLSVLLSLFAKSKEWKKRAQRGSGLKELLSLILFTYFLTEGTMEPSFSGIENSSAT